MGAIIIVDAFWGDSGKGKTCAYLARKLDAPLAVRAGVGTNAGATVIVDDNTTIRARQIPTGIGDIRPNWSRSPRTLF